MSTNSKLQLYSSIERNLKVGEACIFLFAGFRVVTLILMKFLNLFSQNRGVGLESKILKEIMNSQNDQDFNLCIIGN